MSELRQNILTESWTVMAPERGEKPVQFENSESIDIRVYPEYDESCPFCPNNEERFPNVIVDQILDGDGNWAVRTIENKYKIFDDCESCPAQPEPFHKHGVYSHYKGCGNHFLIVENRLHNRIIGDMEVGEIYDIFLSYSRITNQLKQNPNNNFISVVFKNQGPMAGASQPHAHSQIVGSRIVPRMGTTGGFEMGTRIPVNSVLPEEAVNIFR